MSHRHWLKFGVQRTFHSIPSSCAHDVVVLTLCDFPFYSLLSIFSPIVLFILLVFTFFFHDVGDKYPAHSRWWRPWHPCRVRPSHTLCSWWLWRGLRSIMYVGSKDFDSRWKRARLFLLQFLKSVARVGFSVHQRIAGTLVGQEHAPTETSRPLSTGADPCGRLQSFGAVRPLLRLSLGLGPTVLGHTYIPRLQSEGHMELCFRWPSCIPSDSLTILNSLCFWRQLSSNFSCWLLRGLRIPCFFWLFSGAPLNGRDWRECWCILIVVLWNAVSGDWNRMVRSQIRFEVAEGKECAVCVVLFVLHDTDPDRERTPLKSFLVSSLNPVDWCPYHVVFLVRNHFTMVSSLCIESHVVQEGHRHLKTTTTTRAQHPKPKHGHTICNTMANTVATSTWVLSSKMPHLFFRVFPNVRLFPERVIGCLNAYEHVCLNWRESTSFSTCRSMRFEVIQSWEQNVQTTPHRTHTCARSHARCDHSFGSRAWRLVCVPQKSFHHWSRLGWMFLRPRFFISHLLLHWRHWLESD